MLDKVGREMPIVKTHRIHLAQSQNVESRALPLTFMIGKIGTLATFTKLKMPFLGCQLCGAFKRLENAHDMVVPFSHKLFKVPSCLLES